ncbi:MAG: PT domain-containing protein [Clostridia bacterium]|nr:PT domain-containing protein [Clostridia bacterium]
MKKRMLKIFLTSALIVSMVATSNLVFYAETTTDVTDPSTAVDIEVKTIYDSWINYPSESFGYAYNAGWKYDSEHNWINTTQNVGWTGFYNPAIDNLTTGQFAFKMKNDNFDPCGFTWGMRTGGTDDDPEYSFYAYEECDFRSIPHWSIAYISSWHPAKSGIPHQGPLYHATIDADDSCYDHTGKDADKVGFAEGEVLAHGELSTDLVGTFHDIIINVGEKEVTVSINGEELATVEADVQAGSFGPYAVSDPEAYFSDLKMTSTNKIMLNPVFEYTDETGTKINETYVGEKAPVVDLSTFEGSKITDYYWTVTKDGEEIYTGKTPYTEYTKEAGVYETALRIKNEFGIMSDVYTDTLTVHDFALVPDFIYTDKDGKKIEKAVTGDSVSVKDNSEVKGSPLAETKWEVKLDGKEIYTGTTPYDKYTEKAGIYETTLTLTNEKGVSADCTATLEVEKAMEVPTDPATETPTDKPTETPTSAPTQASTNTPTSAPTQTPTNAPANTQSGKVVNTGTQRTVATGLTAIFSALGITALLKKKKHN